MPLRRVLVEGFRGIRRADLTLQATTALVGENNCGKTTLLDALAVALGPAGPAPPAFAASDFHLPHGSDAVPVERLSLAFEVVEEAPGDWDEPGWTVLSSAAGAPAGPNGERRLLLVLEADRPADGGALAASRARVHPARGDPLEGEAAGEVLAAIRRRYPVLRLQLGQPGALAATPPPRAMTESELETTVRRLERRVTDAYRKFNATWRPRPDELRDALDPVRELAKRYDLVLQEDTAPNGRTLESLIETPVPLGAGNALRPAPPGQGSGAQNLALLATLGAFLAARGDGPLPEGSEPIVLLEDAEAHLHPILLASVFRVVERLPAQRVVTTNSGDLLASFPLHAIRRLVRRPDGLRVHAVAPGTLRVEEARRIAFHVRLNRASAVFARCWLLVEGETEAWLLPELARLLGHDFPAEGVRCVEYSQCGVQPLVQLARAWGIAWHLLADGDSAGRSYAASARTALGGDPERMRVTLLRERDVEHFLFATGYAEVFQGVAAGCRDPLPGGRRRQSPSAVIDRALKVAGKPGMALEVVEAAARPDSPGVPPLLVRVLETVVGLARAGASW